MIDAVVVSYARTGLAKSWRGALNMTHGATMGAHAVRHAIERAGLAPGEVDDVLIGSAFPEGATGHNIARQSSQAQRSIVSARRACRRSRWLRSASSQAKPRRSSQAASNRSRAFKTK
jgi:acetyl-CoA acetyltransferase